MLIETKYLGEQVVAEEKILSFPQGLPGFQDEKSFVLLDVPGNDVLQILQSLQTTALAFIVTNPHTIYQSYRFSLDEATMEVLQIEKESDIVILSIMTIQEPFSNSTINLKAPIIMNAKARLGKQIILNQDDYPLKAKITLPQNKESGE